MRGLSALEIDLFPAGFCHSIDMRRVQFVPRAHNPFARNKILVRGYKIYWPDVPPDFVSEPLARQAVLMHELCHVWQYATGRLSALGYLLFPARWQYLYEFDPAKSFDDYPTEKQADLLQDWFLMNNGAHPDRYRGAPPSLAQINAAVPFEWGNKAASYIG